MEGDHWSSLPPQYWHYYDETIPDPRTDPDSEYYEEYHYGEDLDNDEEPTPTIPEEYQIIEEEEYEVGPDSLPDEDFIEYLDSLPDEDEELEELMIEPWNDNSGGYDGYDED